MPSSNSIHTRSSVNAVTLSVEGRPVHILGGPYMERIPGTWGVRLAPEIDRPSDFDLLIQDFDVPSLPDYEDGLYVILNAALYENALPYIGCMAGRGRTGLVIAGLARVAMNVSGDEAVSWTRANYNPHAVETAAQRALVGKVNAARVRKALANAATPSTLPPTVEPRAASLLSRIVAFIRG